MLLECIPDPKSEEITASWLRRNPALDSNNGFSTKIACGEVTAGIDNVFLRKTWQAIIENFVDKRLRTFGLTSAGL